MSNEAPTDALRLVPVKATPQQLETAAFNLSAEIGAAEAMKLGPHIKRAYELLVAAAPASPLPGGGPNHLGNLLARIHRDGGHRQEAVGTDQACGEAEIIVSRLLQDERQWRKIDTFTGSGQGNPVLVAVPSKEGGWIVGEAWKSVMEADDPYRGNDGWWWAGTSPGDAYSDPIRFMNHGDAEWWMPLPAAPTGDA